MSTSSRATLQTADDYKDARLMLVSIIEKFPLHY